MSQASVRKKRVIIGMLAAAGVAAAVSGCSRSGQQVEARGPARPVTAEAFVTGSTSRPEGGEGSTSDAKAVTLSGTSKTASGKGLAPIQTSKPGQAGTTLVQQGSGLTLAGPRTAPPEPALDTRSFVGEPPAAAEARAAAPMAGGPSLVLESLVGQVNGRPVFASEILGPLDDQLRATAARSKTSLQFKNEAAEPITLRLMDLINNELILAEARASLTPEQKQGLFHFLSRIEQDVVSRQRGSAVAADEALRSEGGSLRQAVKGRLDRQLIEHELSQRIEPRAIVSARQIRQEYERNIEKYQPPPVAVLRRIHVRTDDAQTVEQIKAELASGKSFDEVADSDLNILSRAEGKGRVRVTLVRDANGGDPRFFSIDELNEAAKALRPGDVAGPIVTGPATSWIRLEAIEQPPQRSFYDAQLDIEMALRQERLLAERKRYFTRLHERGNVSDFNQMALELLAIAQQRYYDTKGR